MELETDHGFLVGVDATDAATHELHPAESLRAQSFAGPRRATFVAGRIALARALARLSVPRVELGSDDRGAPIAPAGFVASISHKDTFAVALAAPDSGARIGVDVERVKPIRERLDRMILVDDELARIAALDDEARAIAVLLSFSVKEAVYKAIDPFLRRYVAFHEATLVLPDLVAIRAGFARVDVALSLKSGVAPEVEAAVTLRDDLILSTARARPF